ncbi:hypothetical protein C0991_006772 [Blastosporella zonata]|nr:hypothetical protein C0991_006772 [Blastosporella zonata]
MSEEHFESVTMNVLEEMGAAEETSKYADAHTRPSTAEINKEIEEQQQDEDADNEKEEEEEEDNVYVDVSSYQSITIAEVHTTATILGPASVINYTDAAAPHSAASSPPALQSVVPPEPRPREPLRRFLLAFRRPY